MIRHLLIYFLLSANTMYCQPIGDSLSTKSYDYLYEMIDKYAGTPQAAPYLAAYVEAARHSNNLEELFNGYSYYIHEVEGERQIMYADSLLITAEKAHSNELIGSAYLSKGVVYYQQKNFTDALKNYIVANRFIATTGSDYLKNKVKYNIALVKYYLGYYHEAFALFKQAVNYFEKEDRYAYVNSLHNLALTANRLEKLSDSEKYLGRAYHVARQLDYYEILPHLQMLQGINSFYRGHYDQAMSDISEALTDLADSDFAARAVGLFYLGKANWDNGHREAAVGYFQKVDSIVVDKKYIRPDLRQSYEYLINYFHNNNDPEKELYYIKKLLKVDAVLNETFKYLSARVHREYDTYSLLEAKKRIEQELNGTTNNLVILCIVAIILFVALSIAIYRHIHLRRIYHRRFSELVDNKFIPQKEARPSFTPETLDINPEVVAAILEKLDQFEKKLGFLKQDLTAPELAKAFNTNYKYLSKIIHFHRSKTFIAYLNDLRIDYIVLRLEQTPKMRHYTNAALAQESGFSTAQHFTRAFGSRVNIPPSFFIQELIKRESAAPGDLTKSIT